MDNKDNRLFTLAEIFKSSGGRTERWDGIQRFDSKSKNKLTALENYLACRGHLLLAKLQSQEPDLFSHLKQQHDYSKKRQNI